MDDRAALKRQVPKALRVAGELHLEPIELRRSGRGGRMWLGDRNWWQLNVWFDPSGFSVATYLSVGPQLYWDLSENATMSGGPGWGRQPVKGFGRFASFEGKDGPVRPIVDAFAARAAEVALAIDAELNDDWGHLDRLAVVARSENGLINNIEAVLLANRLLDRRTVCEEVVAEQRSALLADPDQHQPWSRNATDRRRLDDLEQLVSTDDARGRIGDRIDAGRALLGQGPMAVRPAFLLGPRTGPSANV
jgi:hypothetical protein